MKSKNYTNRSNCVRAAKVALGKSAKPGTEFTVEGSGKEWTWTPTAKSGLPTAEPEKHDTDALPVKAKKQRRAKNGEKSNILEQPQMAKVLGLMQRQTGASVEEIAERINCNRDTARGMVSRVKSAGAPVTTTRESRFVRYVVAAEWHT